MTIDIERLKTDLDYWNEVAPEGAEWYSPDEPQHHEGWHKKVEWGHEFTASRQLAWGPARSFNYRTRIPRPSTAWNGEGLPPVGVECELTLDGINRGAVTITYTGDGVFCYKDSNEVEATGALYCAEFRLLKTEKERVVDAAMYYLGFSGTRDARITAEKLYDAGLLRMPKGEK